ncbi:uncharacterized protein LOC144167956 [Haemaphysalis longicornis]
MVMTTSEKYSHFTTPDLTRERCAYAVTAFPQGVGALDGCHFAISPPKENAVDYYNSKGGKFFRVFSKWCGYSMILLALVDHRYRFLYINIGSPGRCHDAHVNGRSKLCKVVQSAHFKSPTATIEGAVVGPLILCDQAFPLTQNLVKPYPYTGSGTSEAAFNYNLSKTRRVVENALGRLKARFLYTMKRMECKLPNVRRAIRASCTLHNNCEGLGDTVDTQWEQDRRAFDALYEQPVRTTRASTPGGQEARAALGQYFLKLAA